MSEARVHASPAINLTRLHEGGVSLVADHMARAFQDDPTAIYIIPNNAKRARHLPWMLATWLRYGLRHGEVWTHPTAPSGAIWLGPDETEVTPRRMLGTGMLRTPLRIGLRDFRQLGTLSAQQERHHHQIMTEPHWYLWLLAVSPDAQGQGIGSTLIRHKLAEADANRLPCYLETFTEANARYYERFGFQVVVEDTLPGTPVTPWWGMRRNPA